MSFTRQELRFFLFLLIVLALGAGRKCYQYITETHPSDRWMSLYATIYQTFQERSSGPATKKLLPITKRELVSGVNINTASVERLQTLPKIGPVLAERIVDYRSQNGPFRSKNDLTQVNGIGPKTLERLRERIIVEKPVAYEKD